MKMLFSTALLSVGWLIASGQPSATQQSASELQVGLIRETVKTRDLQTSPMLYMGNLNGLRVGFTQRWNRHQLRVNLRAATGSYVAPGLGVRSFSFADEATEGGTPAQPLVLIPTLYRGGVDVEYLLRFRETPNHRQTWWGIGFHEQAGYADGVAMTTWAMNTASASLLHHTRWPFGRRHLVALNVSLPLVAAVTRLPYSNVVSSPDESNAKAFMQGTQWETLPRFINPQVGLSYRFRVSPRWSAQAAYRYSYLRYPDPELIRTAAHTATLSLVYHFNFIQP
ncbi:hypothetical protein GCM10023189_17750 [Nibrella saemangeumensis]|uniref:Outer membrane protein beta-barrel domain-containing protein n=1 Tax=Nibrella saemangeumensis TaxID=1084526 RepID=A0ABP8MRK4_9BACT